MAIKIYMESIEQAVMEYIERRTGIPVDELCKYPMKLYNSGYRDPMENNIQNGYVSTHGDLKCAKIVVDIPTIDKEVD